MNRFAYLTTGLVVKAISELSRANIEIHGKENIPSDASIIFTVNHFTRMETLILPSHIYELMGNTPVWSLADAGLFKGSLKNYLDRVGAISTKDPDRDHLIVKTLLNGTASWIIFPEGRMVKNKKIMDRGKFMISYDGGKHPPHTGAATLALRCEFLRKFLRILTQKEPERAGELKSYFEIESTEKVLSKKTCIVPVNITYYPMRARENILSKLAVNFFEEIGTRAIEEIMTEGTMLISGVDVDIRFGKPIDIAPYLDLPAIKKELSKPRKDEPSFPTPSKKLLKKPALKIMFKYMSAIYEMTTINHDHLFSSIIRMRPLNKINSRDLLMRVFLATLMDFKDMGIFYHKSLEGDQIHLLIDDRFDKWKDFLLAAIEKDVLRQDGTWLIKDKSFSTSLFDFHKIRMENPVVVIANEVEPLKNLRKKLWRLAWLPAFIIRKKTSGYLFDIQKKEFDTDYKEFFVEGESKPKKIGAPYLIKGKKRDMGVLLVHGYMSAPREMSHLAEFLGKKDFFVHVPRLRGHGTSPEDLATRTCVDWMDSVDKGFALIKTLCKKIIVGGFSTGAALALNLAARSEDLGGVFAICPPRRLQDASLKKNLAKDIWKRIVEKVKGDAGNKKEFIENRPENSQIAYRRNPVSGIREVELLMEGLDPLLPKIKIPALVVHSCRDPIANPEESKRIFEGIGSKDKQYILFNFKRHGILAGDGSERVHSVILDFIDNIN